MATTYKTVDLPSILNEPSIINLPPAPAPASTSYSPSSSVTSNQLNMSPTQSVDSIESIPLYFAPSVVYTTYPAKQETSTDAQNQYIYYILIIFIVIFVLIMIFFIINSSKEPAPAPAGPVQPSKQNCRGTWKDNKCVCTFPYIGPSCDILAHDLNYIDLGITDSVSYASQCTEFSGNLTFGNSPTEKDPNSCTAMCDKKAGCNGVVYKDGCCELITSDIVLSGDVYFDPKLNNIFIKKTTLPIMKDRVSISNGVKRYWLTVPIPRDAPLVTADSGELVTLIWGDFNNIVVSNSNLIGLWYNKPFTIADWDRLAASGEAFVDNNLGTNYPLSLPTYLLNEYTLYVMYKGNKPALSLA